jgi:hypothetical protein
MILRLETTTTTTTTTSENGGEEEKETMDISISLKETAHSNASALFAKYRANKEKSQKTKESSAKALQAAEETAQRQLLEAKKRQTHLTTGLQTKRKPLWFEKFHWFFTSDNYLVLAGRDAQQNEQLVKRYLRPGDAYLHADVHGAASCLLRAKRRRNLIPNDNGKKTTQTMPLSDQALREAGNFTICRSSAWTSRMVTSAWWVESHQVTKTAPTGEYLTVGSFMIRGKKNFLPPTPLEMGLGVLFRLGDDEAVARHKNERRDFALMQLEEGETGEDLDDVLMQLKEGDTGEVVVEKPSVPEIVVEEGNSRLPEKDILQKAATKKDTIASESKSDQTAEVTESPEAPKEDTPVEEEQEQADKNQVDPGVGDGGDEAVQDPKQENAAAPAKAKKGLSVRERKQIKKYGSLEAAQAAEEERNQAEEQKKAPAKPKSTQPAPTNQKRGKKAKMKRMAKKYVDQDDEDRELALLALHAGEKEKKKDNTRKVPEISETEKAAAAQTVAILNKDAAIVAEQLPEAVRETLAKCVTVQTPGTNDEPVVRWDKFDADVLEQLESFEQEKEKIAAANRLLTLKESTRIDNFSASLAGIIRTIRKYGHKGLEKSEANGKGDEGKRKTKTERVAEHEDWKKTLAEEGVLDDELEDDAVDDTAELNKLTGKPHNDDLILYAVPVCAPYHTLSKYSYRVKLTPGNMKRGKASKGCIEMFVKDGQKGALSDRNKDLIKKVADHEWVQAICGDVKISAAGASKAIQKQKAKNKSKKKK